MAGPIAPPNRPPPRKMPKAVERWLTGIQRPKAELTAGERQASMAPNVKRIVNSEIRFQEAAVSPVNSDQPRMPSVTMARAEAVGGRAPRGLEDGIGQTERAEDLPHLQRREDEFTA